MIGPEEMKSDYLAETVEKAQSLLPAPSAKGVTPQYPTPDAVVAKVWERLPKMPAMWDDVDPSSPPIWLYEIMDKALALLADPAPQVPAQAAPEGWALVPVDASEAVVTPAMCVAASDAAMERGITLPASHAAAVIEAALRAAPPAPAPALSGWQPMETAPKDGSHFLAMYEDFWQVLREMDGAAAGEDADPEFDEEQMTLIDDWRRRLLAYVPMPMKAGEQTSFTCGALKRNSIARNPQDCNWPFCGCDPHADRVIAALEDRPSAISHDDDNSNVIAEIAAERRRQIEGEGWTSEHDAAHGDGDLALAGACYARYAATRNPVGPYGYPGGPKPRDWPWGDEWWKPKDRRRDLIRAAALIVAEIERLDRAAARAASGEG